MNLTYCWHMGRLLCCSQIFNNSPFNSIMLMWFLTQVVSPSLRVKGSFCDRRYLAYRLWGLLEPWPSVIHCVAEWQGGHCRGSSSQHFTWVNTVQPLATCHSLCLQTSLWNLTLSCLSLKNLARFSSLLNSIVRPTCEVLLDLLSEETVHFTDLGGKENNSQPSIRTIT